MSYVTESRNHTRTKAQNLIGLIKEAYALHLLRREHGGESFLELRVEVGRMNDMSLNRGGFVVFG